MALRNNFLTTFRYLRNAQKTDPDNLEVLHGLLLVALRKDDKEFMGQIKELESKYELIRMPIVSAGKLYSLLVVCLEI